MPSLLFNISIHRCFLLQLIQSNFVLFCTYAVELREHFQNIVLTILVSEEHTHQLNSMNMVLTITQKFSIILSGVVGKVNMWLMFCTVYLDVGRSEYPILAVVPWEVREENSSFLRHYSNHYFIKCFS